MKRKIYIYIASVLLPLLMLPLALSSYKESQCAYIILIVAASWLLEPAPTAAVSLLPVVLFPLFGIISSKDVCKNYMQEIYITIIGGIMAATAVENCKLHERIALKVLLCVGTSIKWILLGFMLTTAFLSMWMTNTAATTVMLPIVDALVGELSTKTKEAPSDESNSVKEGVQNNSIEAGGKTDSTIMDRNENMAALRVTFLLGICYAANIGGTGTLIGTGPNLTLVAFLEKLYPGSDEITFTTWMIYNIPGLVICVIIGWFYLWLVNIYFSKKNYKDATNDEIHGIISKRYWQLGSLSSHETSVMVLFSLLIVLWLFRDPKFMPGWASLLGFKLKVGDSVAAVAILFLMFFLPSNFRDLNSPPILQWKTAQAKFPWGVIFLIGAGASLAQGAQVSGLSALLGLKLSALSALSPGLIITIVCLSTAAITEFMTNITVTVLLLPILSQMALTIGVNPLYLMLPTTVSASFAFMLPVATIPNAIVFEAGNMKTMDLLKPGFVMNLVCCCVQLFMLHTLGVALFDLNKFPSWAQDKELTSIIIQNHTNIENLDFNATQILNSTVSL